MKKMNNKGFSLVELIIVIAIMAILAGALAPALLRYIEKTRVSNDKSTAANLKMAIETALADEAVMDEVASKATAVTDKGVPAGAKFLKFEIVPANASTGASAGKADYSKYTAGTLLPEEIAKTIPSKKLVIKSKKDLDNKVFVVAIALGGQNQADVVEVYLKENNTSKTTFIDTQGNKITASPSYSDLIN